MQMYLFFAYFYFFEPNSTVVCIQIINNFFFLIVFNVNSRWRALNKCLRWYTSGVFTLLLRIFARGVLFYLSFAVDVFGSPSKRPLFSFFVCCCLSHCLLIYFFLYLFIYLFLNSCLSINLGTSLRISVYVSLSWRLSIAELHIRVYMQRM